MASLLLTSELLQEPRGISAKTVTQLVALGYHDELRPGITTRPNPAKTVADFPSWTLVSLWLRALKPRRARRFTKN